MFHLLAARHSHGHLKMNWQPNAPTLDAKPVPSCAETLNSFRSRAVFLDGLC